MLFVNSFLFSFTEKICALFLIFLFLFSLQNFPLPPFFTSMPSINKTSLKHFKCQQQEEVNQVKV